MHYKETLKKGWLYAEAFKGKDFDLTIKSIGTLIEKNRNDEEEEWLIAYFHETDKKLKLNLTNCETIEELLGDGDTENWTNKTVTFYPLKGKWFNKKRVAVRVRTKLPVQKFNKEKKEKE